MKKTEERQLLCALTAEEVMMRADMLASRLDAIRESEKERENISKRLRDEQNEMKEDTRRLSRIVRERRELRVVSCTWVDDYNNRIRELIRDDTGEIVDTKEIKQSELQQDLPIGMPQNDHVSNIDNTDKSH